MKFLHLPSTITTLLLLLLLPSSIIAYYPTSTSLTTWEQIHQTLNIYPLAIDGKNTSLFPSVFTSTATANYTGPLSSLDGIQNITASLILSVSQVLSQHQLGTTVINIDECSAKDGSGCTASSSTYFTASLFGLPGGPNNGKYVILFGRYEDQLIDTGVGENGWRITTRELVFMAPLLGDCTLIGDCP